MLAVFGCTSVLIAVVQGSHTEQVLESLRDIPCPGKDPVDALLVGTAVSIGSEDHSDPELPKYPDAGSGAPVDTRLHQRNKDERGHEEGEWVGRDPRVDVSVVTEHRGQNATLQ